MNLRKAKESDSELLLRWANEPETRKYSFNTKQITPEEQRKWLRNKFADPNCHILIGSDNGKLVGVVRFQVENGAATVSVSVDKNCRGKGYGTALIEHGIRYMRTVGVDSFLALVKLGNEASVKAFKRAGFLYDKQQMFPEPMARFTLTLSSASHGH